MALDVLRVIEDTDERAQVLADLAGELKNYPGMLDRALDVTRASRSVDAKARALFAIAPHLPLAQGPGVWMEAFAQVRIIQSEADRAVAIASSAKHYDAQHLALGLALETAGSFENAGALTLVIVALSRYLSPYSDLLTEALRLAQRLERAPERIRAQIALAPHLSEPGRRALLIEALSALSSVHGDERRARLLVRLTSLLGYDTELICRATAMAGSIEVIPARIAVNAALAHFSPGGAQSPVLDESLAAAKAIHDPGTRVTVLVALAPYIVDNPHLLTDAIDMAHCLDQPEQRARCLVAFLSCAPDALRASLAQEILSIASRLRGSVRRSRLIIAVAPHLINLQSLLPQALEMTCSIPKKGRRTYALRALARALVHLPRPVLYEYWQVALHSLALRPRPDLLADLRALQPIALRLGGQQAAVSVAEAVLDIGEWWT